MSSGGDGGRRWRRRGLLIAACAIAAGPVHAQSWSVVTTSRQYAGEPRLAVQVEYGSGEFTLEPGDGNTLYRARIEYNGDRFRPVASYEQGVLRIGLEGGASIPRRSDRTAGALNLMLSPRAPLDLDLRFGAARVNVELGGLNLERMQVATGASETTIRFSVPNTGRAREVRTSVGAASLRAIALGNANAERLVVEGGVGDVHLDFTGAWRGDMEADVSMGVGALTLVLPRSIGVRVVRNTFLTSFDPQGLARQDDGYYSPNWGQAEHHLTIRVGAAFGAISVRWHEGG